MRKSETQTATSKIADLEYVEVVREKRAGVLGGTVTQALSELQPDTKGFAPEVNGEGQYLSAPTLECFPLSNQGFLAGFKTRLFNLTGR